MNFMPKAKAGHPFATAINVARHKAGGNVYAGLLLYRVQYYFSPRYKGSLLERHGREWIAKSQDDWASEAGLFTKAEMRSARERLGQCSFILIAQKKLTYQHPKTLWISLDVKALNAVPLPSGTATAFAPVALSNALKHPAHKPEPPPTIDELLAPVDVDAALKG